MQKKTIFVISFFLISMFVLFSAALSDPAGWNNKHETPKPKDININAITFSVPRGFIEDKDSYSAIYEDIFLNHSVRKEERSFHQNDIFLLAINVYDFKDENVTFDDLNKLNDGFYEVKSINGIEGIFKTEDVEAHSGFVKNNHPRYYFNYIKDNKIVMIQCDVENVLNELVK